MSANALQAAIHAALTADAEIAALSGGRVFDGRPIRKELPHVSFGAWRTEDYSTGTEAGEEHRFEIEVWSEAGGRRQAALLAEAVRAVLHDQTLALTGATLVNLRHLRTRTAREPRSHLFRSRLAFRAVTEPTE